jgi:cobalt-zinc-cadmium efflux system membrane fusion protein
VWLPADSPKLTALTVDTVRARTERTVATLPAQVIANEDHTVRVLSPVAGRVSALLAAPGERVSAGQPLARLISGDYAQALSDLTRARAALGVGEAALDRATDLYAHHVIAARELEQARGDALQARAEEARARARAQQLGASETTTAGEYVLRAPIAGVVLDRAANPGMEVRPDALAPLFTISALGDVWVAVNVYQRDLPFVRPGARMVFTTDAASGRPFEGRVSFVSEALDPLTRTATARAVFPNPDGTLRPQLIGEARLLARDTVATAVIPTKALVTHGTDTVVYVEMARGRFVRRVVTVGDDDGVWASITSGLAVGERIVTDGSILLDAEANRAD